LSHLADHGVQTKSDGHLRSCHTGRSNEGILEAECENDSPNELGGDRNPVLICINPALGSVHGNGGEEDTDSDAELVSGKQSTSNLSWSNLGDVDAQCHRNMAEAEIGDETTSDNEG